MGKYGILGRRYFRKHNAAGTRTHNLHTFPTGSTEILRHLRFRDYLIAPPQAAQVYSQLKQQLAAAHPTDIDAYMDGKDSFIKTLERQALAWGRLETFSS